MSLLSKLIVWLYLALLGTWLFLWQGRLPHHIDATLYAYPDHWINLEAFRKGLLPLWNPYVACGTPHAANWQSACFYPPFWLFNWAGLADWFMRMAVAHAGLAFAGCYLWLRRQKAGPLACTLGALSFAGSAHLTLCWVNLPFIATAAWIPWIFWAFHRALEKPAFQNWFWAGSFLALQVLAGYPFFTFYTVLLLLVWFYLQKPQAPIQKRLWITLLAAASATCLQWLPFLDMLTWSKPGTWGEYPYFDRPLDYLTLFKPDFLGLLGSASYQGLFANGIFNLYFGLVPLGLLVLSVLLARRLKNTFWIFAALAWLLWMAGPHFPLWRWLPLGLLQWLEPSKAVGLFLFCAVTTTALSFQSFLGTKPSFPFKTAMVVLVSLIWALDLFRLPFQLLHPIDDPYRQPGFSEAANKIKKTLAEGRLLSLRSTDERAFTGSLPEALEYQAKHAMETYQTNSNAVWGLRSADRYLFLQVDGSENLVRYYNKGFPYKGDLLAVAGVRVFLLPQPLPKPKYTVVEKVGNNYLNVDPLASPDLRWVGGSVLFPNRPSLLEVLAKPGKEWRQKVYLEGYTESDLVQLPPVSRTIPCFPTKDWVRPSAGQIADLVEAPSSGYLVFNESYAPGWHVWVDEMPQPILRAYGLFMAAAVPAGGHMVEFRYEPASFRLGLFITLLCLAAVMGSLRIKRKTS